MASIPVEVPEDLIQVLDKAGIAAVLAPRWALEAMVLEALREGLISRRKLGEMLGLDFEDRERFLKTRDVHYVDTVEELDKDHDTLNRLFGT